MMEAFRGRRSTGSCVCPPPERTVVVAVDRHIRYLARELRNQPHPWVLSQPDSRGTAAGVLFPAHWIHARDPRAMAAVRPTTSSMTRNPSSTNVAIVAAFGARHPEWIVLLGATATSPETDYGWIEPGPRMRTGTRACVYRVRRFVETPSDDEARSLFAAGCLWNTFVFVCDVATLIAPGQECVPDVHERLARIPASVGTERERWTIRQTYALAPTANFARAVLQKSSRLLAVSEMAGLTWCDLGTPERVMRTMAMLGIDPRRPGPHVSIA
jgi:mannose-1-phosphate guanylyltransferase